MIRRALGILFAVILVGTAATTSIVRQPGLAWATTGSAACVLPYTLLPNTLADATKVMADFNAVVTCIASIIPGGAVTATYYAQAYGSCTWDGSNDVGVCVNLAVAAAAVNGGRVVIPSGNFGLSTTIANTSPSVQIVCGGTPSITGGSGTPTTNTSGTQLKWLGVVGGRMASVATSSGQLISAGMQNCRMHGNNGRAADGLYAGSTFGGNFDNMSFVGGFSGGTILNFDVSALAAGGSQNNTFNNLYIDNGGGGWTSNQLRLGAFIDGAGVHGNAAYNQGSNIFIGGDTGTTGILCVGCDNNTISGRIFNAATSVNLTIAQSGAQLFPANGNKFALQYTGAFVARGTASFAACVVYSTCTYNNSLTIDQTNATPQPTIEAAADLHWCSNSGYCYGYSWIGKATVQPALWAAHDYTIWGACQIAAIANDTSGVAYFCNSTLGGLIDFDSIGGDRFRIAFNGVAGAKNLLFTRAAGTGFVEFSETVQLDNGALPQTDNTGNLGATGKRFGSIAAKAWVSDNGTNSWTCDTNIGASPGDGNLACSHNGVARWTLTAAGHELAGAGTAPALTVCGTSPAIVGDDRAGEVTMGTAAPTGCVITFNTAYVSAPYCVVSWQATPLASQSYAVSNTAITLSQTGTSSNKINYSCMGRVGG